MQLNILLGEVFNIKTVLIVIPTFYFFKIVTNK